MIDIVAQGEDRQTYTYDAVNRVTQQDERAPDGTLTVAYAFAYDANGNRTQETEARPGKPFALRITCTTKQTGSLPPPTLAVE